MNIRVLIIEDDPMVIEVNTQFVNNVPGFQVCGTAKTSGEALKKLRDARYHLALLDIYLPDMDGVTLLREIRKKGIGIDVIMVTAAQDAEIIQNVFRYGAVDYIIKPFKFNRLKRALESYADMHKCFQKSVLNQSELDKLTMTRITSGRETETLPKGLNQVTFKQVLICLLKEGNNLSAEEVAGKLGLARVTARRYLEYLESIGKVRAKFQYGSVGRPVKRYFIKNENEN
ncbi:two-component system response regulator DctR [Desulfallas thermosapovorans DSM 6562]|uniref:Transcriptional regulatory protein n=1 Tax=Desulfallas thermosapovorans DSM 6562 TaxID=1121431 RepID=A0A5S4ZX97_9FIRM|nr:two-component system response regulator DctR [Desulfallas thermosapovorans DSM 6562]